MHAEEKKGEKTEFFSETQMNNFSIQNVTNLILNAHQKWALDYKSFELKEKSSSSQNGKSLWCKGMFEK